MPNAINPFNYDIDKFDSGFLGPITDTNFRTFLFTHNLPNINPVISGVIGNQIADRGTEYNVSQSNPNVTDVPNLVDVANTPSLYNNLSNPREVNIKSNLQNINPQVANTIGTTNLQQAGLGADVTNQISSNQSNIDLPSLENVSDNGSVYNNFTQPKLDNLDRNPSINELISWHPDYDSIFTQNYNDYKVSYGVPQTFRLGFAGNVESWVQEGNYEVTVSQLRQNYFTQNNKWGPKDIISYNVESETELIESNSGYKEYNYSIQNSFKDQILTKNLGVGVLPFSDGSGINFLPDGVNISELDSIARKSREEEIKNRVKTSFVDSTVGALNVSPFNLLSGGDLIQKNYTITVPKTLISKAAQFAADLAGFNLPTSIIPDGSFGDYGVKRDSVDVTSDILDYTGGAQKSFLYNAMYINKYGPTLQSQLTEPPGFFKRFADKITGAGQAPNTINYLNDPGNKIEKKKPGTLIDKINNAVDAVTNKKQNRPNTPDVQQGALESATNRRAGGGFYGKFEIKRDIPISDDINMDGNDSEISLVNGENLTPLGAIDTLVDNTKPTTAYRGTSFELAPTGAQRGTIDERIDWRERNFNPFKKGLLYYTQEIINNSDLSSNGGYIGYFDSAVAFGGQEDYKQGNNGEGHFAGSGTFPSLPSRGNTTRDVRIKKGGTINNTNVGRQSIFTVTGAQVRSPTLVAPDTVTNGLYYCRSWSSRRKYHTWDNLIRSDANWWRISQTLSNSMTMNWDGSTDGNYVGMPKIAWNKEDAVATINQLSNGIKGQVIPYMLSIENLAWKDAPQYRYLPECERGSNGGRIMWFPPYDINFTDNTSVSWDTTSFIGRGENVYTYNHTERSGTLDFTIVVDHSATLNQIKKDFASVMNDDAYHSFFAGCDSNTLRDIFKQYVPPETTDEVISNIDTETKTAPVVEGNKKEDLVVSEPTGYNFLSGKEFYVVYFENAQKDSKGGTTLNTEDIGRKLDFNYENQPLVCSTSGDSRPGLNQMTDGQNIQIGIDDLCAFLVGKGKYSGLDDGKNYTVEIKGYASSKASKDYNIKLGFDRAMAVKNYMYTKMIELEGDNPVTLKINDTTTLPYPKETSINDAYVNFPKKSGDEKNRWNIITEGAAQDQKEIEKNCKAVPDTCNDDPNPCNAKGQLNPNSLDSKEQRTVTIVIKPNTKLKAQLLGQSKKEEKPNDNKIQTEEVRQERAKTVQQIADKFVTECEYFEKLKRTQPFIYEKFTEKIKHFHPAFHAITPESFNSRLTFLQQCTRQGPQNLNSGQPANMVFGRPPVCVLRIGDFYNTKIIIDNVNISYDPLTWDLNPEGIGVQPMLAKVSIGFKFIGGSSLGGPISQLQNAVSYNFFANTGVYQPAKALADATGARLGFIYGGFTSPEQEKNTSKLEPLILRTEQENKSLASNNNETKSVPIEGTAKEVLDAKNNGTTPPPGPYGGGTGDGGGSTIFEPVKTETTPNTATNESKPATESIGSADINFTVSYDSGNKPTSVTISLTTDEFSLSEIKLLCILGPLDEKLDGFANSLAPCATALNNFSDELDPLGKYIDIPLFSTTTPGTNKYTIDLSNANYVKEINSFPSECNNTFYKFKIAATGRPVKDGKFINEILDGPRKGTTGVDKTIDIIYNK